MKNHPLAAIAHRVATVSLWAIWVLTLTLAVAGPLIASILGAPDPTEPMSRSFDQPSSHHLLGTDRLGRDLFARMLTGNIGLVVPPALAAVLTTALGVTLAMVASVSTVARTVIRFFGDMLLAIPAIIVLLAIITAVHGNFFAVATASVLLSVPMSTRYFMETARPIFASGFVRLARATGASWAQIAFLEVVPALRRAIIADMGIRFVSVIFLTATAAFLAGTSGGQDSSWAAMVGTGLSGVNLNPWAVTAPALAIIALTVCPALLLEQFSGGHR